MSKPLRVGIVSYLNTSPYVAGLTPLAAAGKIAMQVAAPAEIADRLHAKVIDLGLVPSAFLIYHPTALRVSDWGIGCDGAVGSVVLCSEVPLANIQFVFPDPQSRTSNLLARLLFHSYWKKPVEWLLPTAGYEQRIAGPIAGLLIGDRALHHKHRFPFVYDLGAAWKEWTGLPIYFGCWVSWNSLPADFLQRFELALQNGLSQRAYIARQLQAQYAGADIYHYLQNQIHYFITPAMQKGFSLFEACSRAALLVTAAS